MAMSKKPRKPMSKKSVRFMTVTAYVTLGGILADLTQSIFDRILMYVCIVVICAVHISCIDNSYPPDDTSAEE